LPGLETGRALGDREKRILRERGAGGKPSWLIRNPLANIAFAKKFIQDSLVQMGVLENDGWKHIEYFTDSFAVDPKNPRVEVVIEDYEGGPCYERKGKN